MNKTRVAIHGAAGRMGRRLVALAAEDPELKLTAAVDWAEHPRIGEDAGLIAGAGELGIPLSGSLDVEVDVIDLMRRRGFPSAEVDVSAEPGDPNRVDLFVTVQPGVPVQFVFEGDPLPSRTRKLIASSYLPVELGELHPQVVLVAALAVLGARITVDRGAHRHPNLRGGEPHVRSPFAVDLAVNLRTPRLG